MVNTTELRVQSYCQCKSAPDFLPKNSVRNKLIKTCSGHFLALINEVKPPNYYSQVEHLMLAFVSEAKL